MKAIELKEELVIKEDIFLINVNILLFPEFETLDAFGPVEVFGHVQEYHIHYVSMTGGTIISKQGIHVLTENIKETDLSGVLLIPGGQGTRPLVMDIEFIENLKNIVIQSKYCLTVCTGSALLAQTKLLDNRKATSNKNALVWVKSISTNVHWVDQARWVVDQKYYTSSGVSAGIDMAIGFIADRFGVNRAQNIAASIEYIWNSDSNEDRFAK